MNVRGPHADTHISGETDAVTVDSALSGSKYAISSGWAYTHANNSSAHHTKTPIDTSPVNGHSSYGISSDWAYDHTANSSAHHSIDTSPVDGHTGYGISSDWAYDHSANSSAHHSKTEIDTSPVYGNTIQGISSDWAYNHYTNASAHHTKTTSRSDITDFAHSSTHLVGAGDSMVTDSAASGGTQAISSGWAYTHTNDSSAHHTKTTSRSDITDFDHESTHEYGGSDAVIINIAAEGNNKGISSHWAFTHVNDSGDPHSAANYLQPSDKYTGVTSISDSGDAGSGDTFAGGGHTHSCARYNYPRIWHQASQPTSASGGDIWIDSDATTEECLYWNRDGTWCGPAVT
ncbi:MAG: hypothetical protein ACTSPB_01630 [Candidatus Thorarchaeota archaeon]